MFESLKKYKTILIILILAAGGFYVYEQYFTGGNIGNPLLTNQDVSGGAAAGEKIIGLLAEVKKIRFDTGLLESSAFLSLVDFTETIQPEAVGRHNPFNPIGIGTDVFGVEAQPSNDLPQ